MNETLDARTVATFVALGLFIGVLICVARDLDAALIIAGL